MDEVREAMVRAKRAGGSSRRTGIRLLAAVVIATLGVAGFNSLVRREPVRLTFGATIIDGPDAVLRTAEHHVNAIVAARHGAQSERTRCYFMTTARTLSGKVGVGSKLACGPVLFVDGNRALPYLTFDLQPRSAAPGHTLLDVGEQPGASLLRGEASGRTFVRPDGERAPAGTDGLQPPPPAAAVGDVLTKASSIGPGIQEASALAILIGRNSGVRLREYGFVDRYGSADQARSAPTGRRLLAFSAAATNGESGNAPPYLSIRVGSTERGPLVDTPGYVVVAVPLDAKNVDLVLTDAGVKQSISLLTGQPSSSNPAVTTRANRAATLSFSKDITVKVASASGSGITSGRISITRIWLSYWCADGSHASSPDRALLHVTAMVRLDGDPHDYGVEPGLLTASEMGGKPQKSRNGAADNATEIDDVIEVPATIVAGTVTYSGTAQAAKGTITVMTPVTVPFRILAG